MKQNQHNNTITSQLSSEKALQKAVEALKSKGIVDPILNSNGDYAQMYARIEVYRQQLAEMVLQFLNEPRGPRPVEEFKGDDKANWYPKAKPYPKPYQERVTRDFTGSNYDD